MQESDRPPPRARTLWFVRRAAAPESSAGSAGAGRADVPPARDGPRADIPALTSLRAVAACLVFFHHFPPTATGLFAAIARQGHAGVTVFFALSGFLITVRYFEAWRARRLRVVDYFTKRVARIFPLYYVVLGLTLALSGKPFDVLGQRLPEWTMAQGFFWLSLAIPTSWSLTVEECFYALAPVVFALVAAAGGLRRRWAWVAILGAVIVGLLGSGEVLVHFSQATGLAARSGFLGSERLMVIYTIFGRFGDFAAGIVGGLAYLRGDVPGWWRRSDASRLGALLFALAFALFVGALLAMDRAGGVFGTGYAAGWKYNPAVAVASAIAIVALTCPASWPARILSAAPLVYLGRISYALYLVQMTAPARRMLLGITLASNAGRVLLLYVAMSLVSALLYELVEKPGRTLTLRAAEILDRSLRADHPRFGAILARVPLRWRRPGRGTAVLTTALAASVVLAALVLAAALALVPRGSAIPIDEALRAVSRRPSSVLTVDLQAASRREGDLHRIPLPARWLDGIPLALLAYVDGAPMPFTAGEPLPAGVSVFRRSLSAAAILVRCPTPDNCETAVLVRTDRAFLLAVGVHRLMAAPYEVCTVAALGGVWAALILTAHRRARPPRAPLLQAAFAATMVALAALLGSSSVAAPTLALAGTMWLVAPFVGPRPAAPLR
jgi:peptidoglycan/LPS O-acetylase OafA/YrhL